MVAMPRLSRALIVVALCLAAAAPCGLRIARADGGGERREVRGTLQRTWSERRQRHEYFVHDADEGVRYYIATDRDLDDYVGRRVTLNGKPRLRKDQKVAQVEGVQVRVGRERDGSAADRSNRDSLDTAISRHRVAPRRGAGSSSGSRRVSSAQFLEEVQLGPDDQIVVEGEVPGAVLDVPPLVESSPYLEGGVPALGGVPGPALSPLAGPVCESCGASRGWSRSTCPCGTPHRIWIRGDYLLWWTKGSFVPPLVTTSPTGTPQADAGVLGEPGTRILYGDERVLTDVRNGLRVRLGTWLDCCQYWGIEGEYFGLLDKTDDFTASSDAGGEPILARPFFNALTDMQDSDLVAYPDLLQGRVSASLNSKFHGFGVRGRWNVFCNGGEQPHGGGMNTCYHGWRLDLIGGYRYLRLREDLAIRETADSLNPNIPVSFAIQDQFNTRNDFHGGDLGMLLEWQRCRWSLELLAKVALGNSHQVVDISGSTQRTIRGTVFEADGGILAQRTNSGNFTQDSFAVVPEVGVTIGYDITTRLRASLGYTLIYWNKVARPGDHIDTVVNPNLFPPEADPFSGPLRPQFVFNDSDFWAQGLDFGLRYIW